MAALCTTRWRWISGILGILCLSLLIPLGILLVYRNQNTKETVETIAPRPTLEFQEGYSSCCSCPQGWIGYKCNCYFISMKEKSWEASKNFCESMNSSLLQMHSKDELNFLRYSEEYFWVGVSYNKDRGSWFWLNGSAVNLNLLKDFPTFKEGKCIWFSTSERFYDESCEEEIHYICKQQHI